MLYGYVDAKCRAERLQKERRAKIRTRCHTIFSSVGEDQRPLGMMSHALPPVGWAQ